MVRLLLVLLPVWLAVEKSAAQTGLVLNEGQSFQMGVQDFPGYTYEWKIYDEPGFVHEATVDEAEFLTSSANAIVTVLWKKAGTYFYKITVHNETGCMNLKYGKVKVVNNQPIATISPPQPICQGDTAQLTVTLTGQGPWSIDLYDGTNTITYSNITFSPFLIPVSPGSTTTYTITRVTGAYGTNTTPSSPVILTIKPKPVSSHIYQY